MVQLKTRFKSLEEYAAVNPSELPEGNYELVNGAIVEMGAESLQNVEIASFLFSILLQCVPHYLLHRGTEIAVSSQQVTARCPDLMVLTEETRAAMPRGARSLISLEMPAPKLVIEVVSPGEPGSDNYNRDYIDKPKEYAQRGIPEYWLIDPVRGVVWVMQLKDGAYQKKQFEGRDRILSPIFPNLEMTAAQILNAGQ